MKKENRKIIKERLRVSFILSIVLYALGAVSYIFEMAMKSLDIIVILVAITVVWLFIFMCVNFSFLGRILYRIFSLEYEELKKNNSNKNN